MNFDPESYRHARTVVLGATGFIGQNIARALHGCGADLYLMVRDAARAEQLADDQFPRSNIITVDLTNLAEVTRRMRALQPAIVFNLAGYGVDPGERDEQLARVLNVDLVETLCSALVGARNDDWAGQALVHVGSALEYGDASGDLREDSTPMPTTLYGTTKLAGTQAVATACKQQRLPCVSARLFTVFGPGEHATRLLPSLIHASAHANPIALTAGTQERDFTYVEDVAEGLLRLGAVSNSAGGVVNLASGRLHTVRQFIECAAHILGIPESRLQFGALPTRAEEMHHAPVSIDRLKSLTYWSPATSIGDGIRRTLARQNRS